jgi:DNA-binding FrmR family transcriptional regulator
MGRGRRSEAPQPSRDREAPRRAEGHLRSVIAMIEAERPCLELAQQLHAVEKAIGQAKKALIVDHLDHCLDAVVGPMDTCQRQEIAVFKAIAKYL